MEPHDNDDYNFIERIYMLKVQMAQNINILLQNVEKNGVKNLENPKAFIEYLKSVHDVY